MCPLFFNRHVLKYILGRKISWHDLAFFDPVMYESLRQLVVDSETKDASLMFTALDMNFCVEACAEEVSCLFCFFKLMKLFIKVSNGDNHIQNFHFGIYVVGF